MDDYLPTLVRLGNNLNVSMRYVGLLSGLSSVQFFTDANTMHEIAYVAGLSGHLLRTEIPAAKERGDKAVQQASDSLDRLRLAAPIRDHAQEALNALEGVVTEPRSMNRICVDHAKEVLRRLMKNPFDMGSPQMGSTSATRRSKRSA